MWTEFLEFFHRLDLFWKIAGIAGLGLTAMIVVYNRMFASGAFRSLSSTGRAVVVSLIVISVGAVALAAVIVWRPQPFILPSPNASLESPVPAIAPPSQAPSESPYPQVVASCKLNITNSGPSDMQMSVGQIQCVDRPAEKLQVAYIWIDPATYMELLFGRRSKRLAAVFGEAPIIVPNDVHQTLLSLQDQYGQVVDRSNFVRDGAGDLGVVFRNSQQEDWTYLQTSLREPYPPPPVEYTNLPTGPIRLLYYAKDFMFPDYEAMTSLIAPKSWPTGYYYDADPTCVGRWGDGRDPVKTCTRVPLLWRSARRAELQEHSQRMREYYRRFFEDGREYGLRDYWKRWKPTPQGRQYQPPSELDGDKGTVRDLADGPQLAANLLTGVAEGELPEGFVVAQARFWTGVHDEDEGWDIKVYTPTIRLLVLVAEVIGPEGSSFDLASMQEALATRTNLRSGSSVPREGPVVDTKLPLDLLTDRKKIVVPLRMEFNSAFNWQWGTPIAEAPAPRVETERRNQMLEIWKQLTANGETVPVGRSDQKPMAPVVAGFSPLQRRNFLYGPEHRPVSFTLKDGRVLPIRQLDPNFVVIDDGWGKGSCPFVHVKRQGLPWAKMRQVLVGATGKAKARKELVDLGPDVTDVRIAEEEAEMSYLSSVSLIGEQKSGHRKILARRQMVSLSYGQTFALTIPKAQRSRYRKYFVEVEGFYLTYKQMLLAEGATGAQPN